MVVDVKSEGRGALILDRWSRGGKLEMWGGSVVQQQFPILGRPTGAEGLSGCDVYGMNRGVLRKIAPNPFDASRDKPVGGGRSRC
jgi:hypothetical protein